MRIFKGTAPQEHAEGENRALYSANEEQANHYFARCLRLAVIAAALMWLLNIFGFFIVEKRFMNISMPLGIAGFLLPTLVDRLKFRYYGQKKYVMMLSLILSMLVFSSVLTIHMVPMWMLPIILSCQYYSPRYTRFSLIATLISMLIALYAGMLIGVWDANLMRMAGPEIDSLQVRLEVIRAAIAGGDNLPLRLFKFYYIPRACTAVVIYLCCKTLSRRTRELLVKQDSMVTERERIGTELNIATQIQEAMLPRVFPAFPQYRQFDIHASMKPAKEVGGDFYDFFMVDESHLAIIVADVSGKGIPAALYMMIGKTLIKVQTKSDPDLAAVFEKVNRLLCESNSMELFITAFEGILDLRTGELVFVNAGHELPFITRDDAFAPEKIRHGFVLAGLEETRYHTGRLVLKPGDKLFQYTDGVTEATNGELQLFGMERLTESLNRHISGSPAEIIKGVHDDIDAFVGSAPQFDDITMLCLEFKEYYKG